MGGNASTGLGSADHHSLRDMKSKEADDRRNPGDEDTNRKSLFSETKTLHNGARNVELGRTSEEDGAEVTRSTEDFRYTEDTLR